MMKLQGEWLDRPETKRVMATLVDAGHEAYFVGGCVRNGLLGVAVNDVDIATSCMPEAVLELASSAGLKAIPTGIEHGTVTVVAGGESYEITTYRKDVETDGRHATVRFADNIEDDARRRDFTMNALYADGDGNVIDPLGGLDDLKARRVRFIDDPDARIKEDYLRILRLFRFHAWYGDEAAGLDADGLAAVAENADGIDGLSGERLGAEMKKLLGAPNPAPSIAAMRQTGALSHVIAGADDRVLAPLIHLEAGIAPGVIRRLAILGGLDVPDRLRLSRAEAKYLKLLRNNMGSAESVSHLGYRHGEIAAVDIELLRAASLEMPLSANMIADAKFGADQTFPVSAVDLMPEFTGNALGEALNRLENSWIESNFQLGKEALLAQISDA